MPQHRFRSLFAPALALSACVILAACGSEDGGGDPVAGYDENASAERPAPVLDPETPPVLTETIYDIVGANPDLSTLAKAIDAAGLKPRLSGDTPYTLFAPNNIAFDKLGSETLQTLMAAESSQRLASVLGYHLVPGKLMIGDIRRMIDQGGGSASIETSTGATMTATIEAGQVVLADPGGHTAALSVSDVEAANGVIHAIDTVLQPDG